MILSLVSLVVLFYVFNFQLQSVPFLLHFLECQCHQDSLVIVGLS